MSAERATSSGKVTSKTQSGTSDGTVKRIA